jgi:predicted transcriptional regulator
MFMFDVYELAPSMKLLIAMHNMSCITQASALNMTDLKGVSGFSGEEVNKAIEELVCYGYVEKSDSTYYLSRLGISVIRSVYT